MNHKPLYASALLVAAAVASAPIRAEDKLPAFFDDVGISVGTGPLPLDTLSAGLTGLGLRLYKSAGPGDAFVSLSHIGGNVSQYNEGARDERYLDGIRGTSLSGGLRFDLGGHDSGGVLPYAVGAGLLGTGAYKHGRADDGYSRNTASFVGLFGGVGLDASLLPVLSVGVEVGGMGVLGFGSDRDGDGEIRDKHRDTVLSSYASVQITVWR